MLSDLQKLPRRNVNGKRLYETPDGSFYPSVTTITGQMTKKAITEWRQRVGEKKANEITKIAAARKALDDAAALIKYKTDRTTDGSTIYASFGDQLDMLYKDMVAGKLDTTGTWATHIKAVKDANPKP